MLVRLDGDGVGLGRSHGVLSPIIVARVRYFFGLVGAPGAGVLGPSDVAVGRAVTGLSL